MNELFTAGDVVGGFRIEGVLGRGGMGVIYLAAQPRLHRRVALKVITPLLAKDPIFRARFEREAQHAASLDHPNVVPIFAAGEDGASLYIAMRYVDGQDLGELLHREDRLDLEASGRIAHEVASALDAAHRQGLIHRDVKPANILLAGGEPDGHVYLTDFGLTKEAASQSHLTNTGNLVGTLGYVAPEQIEGGRVDARADTYALGCVLYQMIVGKPPYQGNDAQKIHGHLNREIPSVSSFDPEVGRSIDPVIARAMAKKPSDRYPSAGDLGRAAVSAAAHQPSTTPEGSVATGVAATGIDQEPTVDYEPRPTARRAGHRDAPTLALERPDGGSRRRGHVLVMAAIAAIGLSTLAVGAVLLTRNGDEPAAEPDPGPVPVVETTTTTTTSDSQEDSATFSSAAPARYAFYAPSDTRFGYGAKLPLGNGWSRPVETMPYSDELLRTTVRGPNGSFVLIDRTPDEEPTISGYESVQAFSQPTYGPAKEYVISSGEAFAECADTSCVDIQMKDGAGGGWGILAGGPDLAFSKEIAARVAQSIYLGD